eukprot:1157898-Pelagomonas_calceolata.AAC.11
MAAMLGGEVKAAAHGGEYGRMAMNIQPDSKCFSYLDKGVSSLNVWMSHGDEAVKLPEGFKTVAMSQQVGQHGWHEYPWLEQCNTSE